MPSKKDPRAAALAEVDAELRRVIERDGPMLIWKAEGCECPARKALATLIDHLHAAELFGAPIAEAVAVLKSPCPCEEMRQPFDASGGRNRYRPCPRCKATSGMGMISNSGGTGIVCACGCAGPRISGPPAAWKDKWAFDAWNDIEREPEAVAERDQLRQHNAVLLKDFQESTEAWAMDVLERDQLRAELKAATERGDAAFHFNENQSVLVGQLRADLTKARDIILWALGESRTELRKRAAALLEKHWSGE